LFARFRFKERWIVVEEATGLRANDRRTSISFIPDRKAEQAEINNRHHEGMHYIGDWHTHREDMPHPSTTDFASIGECVLRSMHDLNGFLLVIVGRAAPPEGLHVSFHDGACARQLVALSRRRRLR